MNLHPMLEQLTQVADYPDDFPEKFCEWMLTEVSCGEDVDLYWICDLFIKQVDERRKFVNERMKSLCKAWKARKEELKPDILAVIDEGGEGESRTVYDNMGSVSIVNSVAGRSKIDDKGALVQFLLEEGANPEQDSRLELIVQLTSSGKLWASEETKRRHYLGEKHLPGMSYNIPARTLATKRRNFASNDIINNLVETSIFSDHRDVISLDGLPNFEGGSDEEYLT